FFPKKQNVVPKKIIYAPPPPPPPFPSVTSRLWAFRRCGPCPLLPAPPALFRVESAEPASTPARLSRLGIAAKWPASVPPRERRSPSRKRGDRRLCCAL
ncbi:hypothetical protein IscW_ISCW023723, partial [Ixodes scapularis]